VFHRDTLVLVFHPVLILHSLLCIPHYLYRTGMYAGGQGGGIKSFEFVYRLPEGMYGDEILLQWLYITANSCSPPGYAEYFAAHPELPSSYWTPGVATCQPPYPNDGTRGTYWPERFYNCAEVKILQSGTLSPTISPKPTPAPTTGSPTVSLNPTLPPATTPSCLAEWTDCTYDWSGCCEGLKCTQVNQAGWGLCLVDTCTVTAPPTNAATPNPTTPPTSGGTYCCGDRNTGYQQCNSSSWCNENTSNCKTCGGFMTTVPLQQSGCCSWGGDCSSQDPSTNPGCHYLQSDCEGSCGGTWQAFLLS